MLKAVFSFGLKGLLHIPVHYLNRLLSYRPFCSAFQSTAEKRPKENLVREFHSIKPKLLPHFCITRALFDLFNLIMHPLQFLDQQ